MEVESPPLQHYCLKWHDHSTYLIQAFSRLLEEAHGTDVILAVEGRTIQAHKAVLSACSGYFDYLFSTFNEKNQIVILKDVLYENAQALIEFMYRGQVNVAQNQVTSLLQTAEGLKIKGLTESVPISSINSLNSMNSNSLNNQEEDEEPKDFSIPNINMNLDDSSPEDLTNNQNHQNHLNQQFQQKKTFTNTSNKSFILPDGKKLPPGATLKPNGEIKRKRGRPRTLDVTEEPIKNPLEESSQHKVQNQNSSKNVTVTENDVIDDESNDKNDKNDNNHENMRNNGKEGPTPGGPLTDERIATMNIIKMNEYLVFGTRQQFWDQECVGIFMQAVRNKEIEMKAAAELLGVSYGTLYGRYRETFGYLKHAWNLTGGKPTLVKDDDSIISALDKKETFQTQVKKRKPNYTKKKSLNFPYPSLTGKLGEEPFVNDDGFDEDIEAARTEKHQQDEVLIKIEPEPQIEIQDQSQQQQSQRQEQKNKLEAPNI